MHSSSIALSQNGVLVKRKAKPSGHSGPLPNESVRSTSSAPLMQLPTLAVGPTSRHTRSSSSCSSSRRGLPAIMQCPTKSPRAIIQCPTKSPRPGLHSGSSVLGWHFSSGPTSPSSPARTSRWTRKLAAESDRIVKQWYREREEKNRLRDEGTKASVACEMLQLEFQEEQAGIHRKITVKASHHGLL
jgi:hypothetical protein